VKITDLFVKRPVLAIVVNLVILIAGLQSIRSLSVRQYPRSDIAVVRVTTAYVGANADLVRGFITTPLEPSSPARTASITLSRRAPSPQRSPST
jgi:multidrug efflux pump